MLVKVGALVGRQRREVVDELVEARPPAREREALAVLLAVAAARGSVVGPRLAQVEVGAEQPLERVADDNHLYKIGAGEHRQPRRVREAR